MNPGFEVGKKPLPKRIMDCFTNFFIDPIVSLEDIYQIIKGVLFNHPVISESWI